MSCHNVLTPVSWPRVSELSLGAEHDQAALCFLLRLILPRDPLLLGQVSSQADLPCLVFICFAAVLPVSSPWEQTFFLPASGLISLIIVDSR